MTGIKGHNLVEKWLMSNIQIEGRKILGNNDKENKEKLKEKTKEIKKDESNIKENDDNNIEPIDFDAKSENNCGKKLRLFLDVDLINKEYETNLVKFCDEVKSLALHCNDFILGKESQARLS